MKLEKLPRRRLSVLKSLLKVAVANLDLDLKPGKAPPRRSTSSFRENFEGYGALSESRTLRYREKTENAKHRKS